MVSPGLLADGPTVAAEGAAPGLMATEMATGRAAGPEPALERGATIGRYLILERLGSGGMGVVFLAYDPELDRKLALKLLHTGPAAHAEVGRVRLLREAQAMAKLTHPNVVAVHDVGTFAGQVFVAMDFVRGQTLGGWLAARKLPWREVVRLFLQAGAGLAAAHAVGLVHRDFKPDNVLVGDDGRVCVTDFGLARVATEVTADEPQTPGGRADSALHVALTQAGAVMGTPAYMAPEQYHGDLADARTDQFAFCIALWEALHGERPFAGDTLLELAEAVTQGALRSPGRAAVPSWLRRALRRGLAVDPAARWPTMTALLAELARDRWRSRGRWLAGIVAVAVLGGSSGGLWLAERQATASCAALAGQAAALWREQAPAIEAALRATGVPYAAATWQRIDADITAWSEDWGATTMEACMSERTGDVLAAGRLACSEQALPQLRRWVELLLVADRTVAARAAQAARRLPDPRSCREPWRQAGATIVADPERRAQLDAIGERLARAEVLRAAGKYRDALDLAVALRGELEALGDRPALVPALRLLGQLRNENSDYPGAETDFGQAFHLALATGLDMQAIEAALASAQVVGRLQRRAEGEAWLRLAEALQTRVGESAGRERYRLAQVRGAIAYAASDMPAAVAEQTRALAEMERSLPADHPLLADQAFAVAHALSGSGRAAEAAPMFRRTLAQREQELGPDHPDVADVLNGLGVAYFRVGRFPDAIAMLTRALAIYERTVEPDHHELAGVVGNLASTYQAMGDSAAALDYSRRTLVMMERRLGTDHPDYTKALINLGSVLQKQEHLDEAHGVLLRALALAEKQGPEDVKVGGALVNLGSLAVKRGNLADAKDYLERGRAVLLKATGPRSNYVAVAEVGLGNTSYELGDYKQAMTHFNVVMEIREQNLGVDHPDLITPLWAIGRAQRALRAYAQAEAALRRAIAIADSKLGPSNGRTAPVLLELGELLLERGRAREALPLLERSLAQTPRSEGDATELGKRRFALARALWDARGDRRRARQLAEQAREGFVVVGASREHSQAVERWLAVSR